MYKFAAASKSESIVFGSARSGYTNKQVKEWLAFMQNQGIQRVCCLLPEAQLIRYSDLLSVYQQTFGDDHVCWAPIQDFHVANTNVLIGQILLFLAAADQQNKKVSKWA